MVLVRVSFFAFLLFAFNSSHSQDRLLVAYEEHDILSGVMRYSQYEVFDEFIQGNIPAYIIDFQSGDVALFSSDDVMSRFLSSLRIEPFDLTKEYGINDRVFDEDSMVYVNIGGNVSGVGLDDFFVWQSERYIKEISSFISHYFEIDYAKVKDRWVPQFLHLSMHFEEPAYFMSIKFSDFVEFLDSNGKYLLTNPDWLKVPLQYDITQRINMLGGVLPFKGHFGFPYFEDDSVNLLTYHFEDYEEGDAAYVYPAGKKNRFIIDKVSKSTGEVKSSKTVKWGKSPYHWMPISEVLLNYTFKEIEGRAVSYDLEVMEMPRSQPEDRYLEVEVGSILIDIEKAFGSKVEMERLSKIILDGVKSGDLKVINDARARTTLSKEEAIHRIKKFDTPTVYEFDSTMTYYAQDLVNYKGIVYECLMDTGYGGVTLNPIEDYGFSWVEVDFNEDNYNFQPNEFEPLFYYEKWYINNKMKYIKSLPTAISWGVPAEKNVEGFFDLPLLKISFNEFKRYLKERIPNPYYINSEGKAVEYAKLFESGIKKYTSWGDMSFQKEMLNHQPDNREVATSTLDITTNWKVNDELELKFNSDNLIETFLAADIAPKCVCKNEWEEYAVTSIPYDELAFALDLRADSVDSNITIEEIYLIEDSQLNLATNQKEIIEHSVWLDLSNGPDFFISIILEEDDFIAVFGKEKLEELKENKVEEAIEKYVHLFDK